MSSVRRSAIALLQIVVATAALEAVAQPAKPEVTNENRFVAVIDQVTTFQLTATGSPSPSITLDGDLPPGASFNPATDEITIIPPPGSARRHAIFVRADNASGYDREILYIDVIKRTQDITFGDVPGPLIFTDKYVDFEVATNSGIYPQVYTTSSAVCKVQTITKPFEPPIERAYFNGVGFCTIFAFSPGNNRWESSAREEITIRVFPDLNFTTQTKTNAGVVALDLLGVPTCTFATHEILAPPPSKFKSTTPSTNPGVAFPFGLFKYTAKGCTAGITLTLSGTETLPPDAELWQYGKTRGVPRPHWHRLPATILGNKMIVAIGDGSDVDGDLKKNGDFASILGIGYPLQKNRAKRPAVRP